MNHSDLLNRLDQRVSDLFPGMSSPDKSDETMRDYVTGGRFINVRVENGSIKLTGSEASPDPVAQSEYNREAPPRLTTASLSIVETTFAQLVENVREWLTHGTFADQASRRDQPLNT